MKCITYHVGILSRGKGRCSVQMAAYCGRTKYVCKSTNKTYNHIGDKDLVFHKVLSPPNAPPEYSDPEVLWNAVEEIERSKNARVARTVVIGIPNVLKDVRDWVAMVCDYANEYYVKCGMIADVYIHEKDEEYENPHAHILLTTRSIDSDGKWMYKQRRNYLCDDQGYRLVDPKTHKPKLGKSIKANNWDEKERMEEWRKGWADMCNQYFKEKGILMEVDHRSYKRQGLMRKPTKHIGKRGLKSKEIEEYNERIRITNMILAMEREDLITLDKEDEKILLFQRKDKGGKGR